MREADAPKFALFVKLQGEVMNQTSRVVLFKEVFCSWEDALEAFVLFKKAEGYSSRTIKDYRYHVALLFRECPQAWSPQDANKTRMAVLSYLGQDGIAPATFNIRRKYLKAFFSWLADEGAYTGNPLEGIRTRKAEPRIVQHSAEILTKLLKLPDKTTYCGKRDYALLCLSIDTAIRPSEALALELEDVNLKEMTVLIRASIAKTRKSRTLPFSLETAKALQALIASRPREWETPLLFANYEGDRLTVSGWRQRLQKNYAPKLGLKRLSPYGLRHDAALHFLRNGMNPFALQTIMGHSTLDMTKRYIALAESDIREAHETASPVKRFLGSKKRVR
ncbi:tyrosine-type recombinase/integrase [Acetomicrobium sp.]|uniref:tyrosine-type recombinase/integrase n=1 Tax=Acetomicrobium sp. TaxID=1872099 RepID=UPI002877832E|nr:tyrosine-type recombinase/integrase [Acetomicrobium sp.]